ncbi:sensor histidine kinase [Amycolatopsis sp. H20-H5]|uniref:sensor histidine kinase n=1 Tax=Amycolatopsis sp. H20-H5 TaxID=3046309 RepID=UPI002DBCD5C6|nr:histidine kinase [Amycolatopsis sp. H20-H5]MEC3974703.1 histidine kinase [Amycolatopsis sp. H20-H5]
MCWDGHVRLLPVLRGLPVWQQDVIVAAATWLVGLVFYLAQLHQLVAAGHQVPLWARLIELTVVCAVQVARRKIPAALIAGTVLLGVDLAIGPSLPIVIAYTDFLYAATLYGTRRMHQFMIGLAAVGTVGGVAGAAVFVPDWRLAIVAALGAVPFLITPVWWATNVRQQRDVADAERANAEQLTKIAELDRNAAVAAERARMARDLHDVIAGHLSAIAIQSEAALTMSDADPALGRSVLKSVRENSVSALEEMRAMIGLLRAEPGAAGAPMETTSPGRLAELSKLVESARTSGIRVDVVSTVDEHDGALPAAIDLTAYRIAQEALTNAVKHAPDSRVTVDIRRGDGILTVEVGNDLLARRLPRAGTSTGTGLLNMRERASAVGGSLSAGPAGSGWLVRAELPLEGLGT